ncbi:hypothetical protein MJO28_003102, partial [Puccinia striiformis f. sp. tritici]
EITNPGGKATGSGIDHVVGIYNFLPDQPSQKGRKFVFPTSEFQRCIPHVTLLQSTLAKISTKLVCCMEDAKGIQSFMSNILCLGQFIIDLNSAPASFPSHPQLAQRVHVWCAPRCFFGDLGPVESKFLGLLLGPVGSSSTPITEDGFTNTKHSLIKYKLLW